MGYSLNIPLKGKRLVERKNHHTRCGSVATEIGDYLGTARPVCFRETEKMTDRLQCVTVDPSSRI